MIYFISGHGNLHFEEWFTHYKPLIDNALSENAHFLIGDFRGTDVLSAEYLKNKTAQVTIAHCFTKPRYRVDVIDLPSAKWVYQGGFPNDAARDAYMTQHTLYSLFNCKNVDIFKKTALSQPNLHK